MQNVHFLNLEYLLVRAYEFVTGFHFGETIPSWISGTLTTIMALGMFLSLVFLVLIVYAQIKLLAREHEGFHGKEAESREHGGEGHPEVPEQKKNDRWERIMHLAAGANESEWRRAILEADIMLGDVLSAQGYPGTSVGEQLRHANPLQMTTLDLAWKAHKVRNDVAHGGENFELTERETRVAIDYYKRVFEEFGAV